MRLTSKQLQDAAKATLVITALTVAFCIGQLTQLADMRAVAGTCKHNGAECQRAMDMTHTEYVCGSRSCWVEVK